MTKYSKKWAMVIVYFIARTHFLCSLVNCNNPSEHNTSFKNFTKSFQPKLLFEQMYTT